MLQGIDPALIGMQRKRGRPRKEPHMDQMCVPMP